MQLIGPLAAGFAGGESGYAKLFTRGTASLSSYYTNAEGEGSTSTANVTLDAHGRAYVYVDEHVDVQVYDSAGVYISEFTVMNADRNVEVISQSFTGQAYAGGGSAASLPVDLQTVLDLWYTSAGALDFKVDIDGTATVLSEVAGAGYGYLFNVKSYGAVGDGATNDRTALLAAKAAADAYGGIVYFPAGTYLLTASMAWDDTPIIGVPGQSIIKSESNFDVPSFGASLQVGYVVYGMTFDCGIFVNDDAAADVTFRSCRFAPSSTAHADFHTIVADGSLSTNPVNVSFVDCYFTHVLDRRCISLPGTMVTTSINNCRFEAIASAGSSGSALYMILAENSLRISNSLIDMSAVTNVGSSSVYAAIRVDADGGETVINNLMVKPPASVLTSIFYGDNSSDEPYFSDSGGSYPGQSATNITLYDMAVNTNVNDVNDERSFWGGRVGRIYYATGTITTASHDYEPRQFDTFYYNKTDSGALTITLSGHNLPPGGKAVIVVENASGVGITLDVSGETAGNATSHTLANTNHTIYYVDYLASDAILVNAVQDV